MTRRRQIVRCAAWAMAGFLTTPALLLATVDADSRTVGRFEAVAAPLDEFVPVTPTRLLDTRDGYGADLPGKAHPGQVVPVITPFATNAAAKAVAVNVKLVDPSGGGFVTVWSGTVPRPLASTLDDAGAPIVNNYTVTELDQFGVFRIFVSNTLTTDLVVDMVGFYQAAAEFAVGEPV